MIAALLWIWPAQPVLAQLSSQRLYVGANQSVIAIVEDLPDASEPLVVRLLEGGTAAFIESASVAPGRIDLAAMFPILWTSRSPRLMYAQLFAGDEPIGSALVIQPLLTPSRATDALTSAVMNAVKKGDRAAVDHIMSAGESWRDRLRQTAHVEPDEETTPLLSGLRIYPDRDIILETTAGAMRIRLRPDAAPNTSFHFLSLVDGGFYDEAPFHRIVNADARGRPFIIQSGDPTGLGAGGPGFRIDFEQSTLRHDFGVLSMARQPSDPDSAGSQFFICLSREACTALDDQYAAFAEVTDGADALLMIAASPVGPIHPDRPSSPHERPLDPPSIVTARSVAAAPYGTGPARIVRESATPIER